MEHYLLATRALLFALSFAVAGALLAPHPVGGDENPTDPPSSSTTDDT